MLACYCDEHSISVLPFDELRSHFKIDFFHDSIVFKDALKEKRYSAILINSDINLLKAIQAESYYNGCPIIVTASEEREAYKLRALKAGAYDFYSSNMKPYELVLKLKNNKKNFVRMNSALKLGSVSIAFSELTTYLNGKPVDLTLIEMKILRLLLRNFPKKVTKEELVNDIWPSQSVLPKSINTHIFNIRTKFKEWEFEVQTIHTEGFTLSERCQVKT